MSLVRVIHIIGSMNRGGAETMIMNIYRKIDKEKIQFDFLVHSKDEGLYEKEILSLGRRVFRIERFNGKNWRQYYNKCDEFFSKHPEISIAHGHLGSSACLYLRAAKKNGIYTVAHSHNTKGVFSIRGQVYNMWAFPTRYIADYFFGCSSEAGRDRYGNRIFRSVKYSNFNNGIDLEVFHYNEEERKNVRLELGINDGEIALCTVGRIEEQKNPLKIANIFLKAIEKYPYVKCFWVGDGSQADTIKRHIFESGKDDRISFLGVRSDVARLLQGFDCFLFPSLWEGLPVTIIEAQATGLPCILSDSISKEVQVTDLIEWLNNDESDITWADVAVYAAKNNMADRKSPFQDITNAGYNIMETTKKLELFYLEHGSNKK